MATNLNPFNLKLLQLTPANIGRMQQVTALDTFDGATKNFHSKGLFSTEIFGRTGDKLRMKNFAYIDVKAPLLHPLVLRILGKLKRIYPEILFGRAYAVWDKELKDFIKATPLDGQTGFTFFMDHYQELVLPEKLSDIRELNIKFLNKVRASAVNERIIISPAGYRDYVIRADGREEEDEVNKLYRSVIAQSNSITREGFKANPVAFDRTRTSLQRAFNEIYEYHENIVRGKNKLTEGKFLTRAVRYGTRGTITSQNLPVMKLHDKSAPSFHSTGVGLFQYLKAFQPVCTFQVKTNYLQKVFVSPTAPASLVNPKTLRAEQVVLPSEMFDLWMTNEGINKLFNYYSEEQFRHDEVRIGDYYLGLIYNDGKVFKLFNSIDELPDGFDRKFVKPMTYSELFYTAVYPHVSEYYASITRFPVTGFGSTYPSEIFLKPTMPSVSLTQLDDQWSPDITVPQAYEFPIRGAAFVNTILPAPYKLSNMGADFDGDKATFMGIFLKEAAEECRRVLAGRNFHVRTDGTIAHSLATDTVKYLIKGMMRNVVKVPAKEGYREERGGEFTHKGVTYNLNRVFAYIEREKIPQRTFSVDKLAWVLEHDKPNAARVAAANLSAPIIVVGHYNSDRTFTPAAVDGLHRVAKAVQNHVTELPGYRITLEQLQESQKLVAIEGHPPLYQDSKAGIPVHLLKKTDEKSQVGQFSSVTSSLLSPNIPGGVHMTHEINGVLVGIPSTEADVPAVEVLMSDLVWSRRACATLTEEEISAADPHGVLDVEHTPGSDRYVVVSNFALLQQRLQLQARTIKVRVVTTHPG